MDDQSLSVITQSLSETRRLGTLLGQLLKGTEIICLEGELGTGKTSLIQGIGHGQSVTEAITSPTFTLVNEYQGATATLYHVDLYRLESTREMAQAGIDAYLFSDGICLIEWAEKAQRILPPEHLYISLKHRGENERHILLQAKGHSYRKLLDRLRRMLES